MTTNPNVPGAAGTRRACLRWASLALLLPLARPAWAIDGAWTGVLAAADGETQEVEYRFSTSGRFVLDMAVAGGSRAFEFARVGQQERWAERGGGYGTLTVRQVLVERQRVQVQVELSLDSGTAATQMRHEDAAYAWAFEQRAEGLHTLLQADRLVTSTSAYTGVRQQRLTNQLGGVLRRRA